jgi:hypothetical protein
VRFFDESEINEDVDVAHDGPAVETARVGNGLVPGKALVKEGGIGCPDRARKQRDVAFGDFFKPNPVIFGVLAGFGFGSLTVALGSAHGITLPSPPQVCYGLGVGLYQWTHWEREFGPEAEVVANLIELQGKIFSRHF